MISSLLLLIIGSIFSTLLRLRSGTILAWYWSRKQPMIHKLVRYGVYAMILPILTIFCDFFSYIENETFSVLQLSSCPVNSIVTSRMSLESMLKVNYSREPTWPTWRNNDFHFCCSLENSFSKFHFWTFVSRGQWSHFLLGKCIKKVHYRRRGNRISTTLCVSVNTFAFQSISSQCHQKSYVCSN